MNRLTNKVALVSGEALGMGRAFADLLAQEGAAVVIADLDHSAGQSAVEA
jgi:NAD(P)-dependent dehydrogenase (short-subunit alcohol dehydrogenase family)